YSSRKPPSAAIFVFEFKRRWLRSELFVGPSTARYPRTYRGLHGLAARATSDSPSETLEPIRVQDRPLRYQRLFRGHGPGRDGRRAWFFLRSPSAHAPAQNG